MLNVSTIWWFAQHMTRGMLRSCCNLIVRLELNICSKGYICNLCGYGINRKRGIRNPSTRSFYSSCGRIKYREIWDYWESFHGETSILCLEECLRDLESCISHTRLYLSSIKEILDLLLPWMYIKPHNLSVLIFCFYFQFILHLLDCC